MAKISKPVLFSKYYKVRPTTLKSLGIFNPTLNADTPLFIDPMLLSGSAHPEMIEASKRYRQYFQSLVSLVSKMKLKNGHLDKFGWVGASGLMSSYGCR
jgi:hypothetical protein